MDTESVIKQEHYEHIDETKSWRVIGNANHHMECGMFLHVDNASSSVNNHIYWFNQLEIKRERESDVPWPGNTASPTCGNYNNSTSSTIQQAIAQYPIVKQEPDDLLHVAQSSRPIGLITTEYSTNDLDTNDNPGKINTYNKQNASTWHSQGCQLAPSVDYTNVSAINTKPRVVLGDIAIANVFPNLALNRSFNIIDTEPEIVIDVCKDEQFDLPNGGGDTDKIPHVELSATANMRETLTMWDGMQDTTPDTTESQPHGTSLTTRPPVPATITHAQPAQYQCTQLNSLEQHMPKHKCPHCQHMSASFSQLVSHMRTHIDDNYYQCTQCAYSCNRSSYMKKHMLVHTVETMFQCIQCAYTCTKSYHLKEHMYVHTDVKPYQCTECSYRCKRPCSLKSHMLVHSDEKRFQCTQCEYRFKRANALKNHVLRHSVMKPHEYYIKCPQCTYMSRTRKDFNAHSRIHSAEKPYKCTARQKVLLPMHMSTCHTDEAPLSTQS